MFGVSVSNHPQPLPLQTSGFFYSVDRYNTYNENSMRWNDLSEHFIFQVDT